MTIKNNQNNNENNKKNNQRGGDGYSVNVNEVIGGRPSFPRYSYNYSPVFYGELLQNGAGNKDKNCGCVKKEKTIFDIVAKYGGRHNGKNNKTNKTNIQRGGNTEKPTQFNAIREVSKSLLPLSTNSLKKLITKTFLEDLSNNKPMKSKQLGGFSNQLSNILAPLGRNNLLVIAALLLLHHFAVEQKNNVKMRKMNIKRKKMRGGNSFIGSINKILAPTGINSLGAAVILVILNEAFINSGKRPDKKIKTTSKIGKKDKLKKQLGGNLLKSLIAPLGTNAFIATGLLVVLEKLFIDKMKYIKMNDRKKRRMIGGRINAKLNNLFNLVAPISFNAFTTKSLYDNITKKMSKMAK